MHPRLLLPAGAAMLSLAVAAHAQDERLLTRFDGVDALRWQTVNDGVMGGLSRGGFEFTELQTLVFAGEISLRNNGGFSSIRSRPQDLRLGDTDGLVLRVRGDGRTYKVSLRTARSPRMLAYWAELPTVAGEWVDVRIPFSAWVPTSFGRTLRGPALNRAAIDSVGFMLYDKQAGPFRLEVDRIAAFQSASAAPATAAAPPSTRGPAGVIEAAIARGVPLFNEGKVEACQMVYEVAARALLDLGEDLSRPVQQALQRALDASAEADPRAGAWALRRALDAAYDVLQG